MKACGEQFTCFRSLKFYPKYIFIFCLGQPASTTVVVSSVATSTTTAQGVSGVSPPKKSRIPPDPNRVPKYHDERLPAGKIFFFNFFVRAKHSMIFYVYLLGQSILWHQYSMIFQESYGPYIHCVSKGLDGWV